MRDNVSLVTVTGPVRNVVPPPPGKRVPRPAGPVVVTVDPRVMARALEAAGGDRYRLRLEPDGSVLVMNRRRV